MDQQIRNMVSQLGQRVDDLETKLRRIEAIVQNIDANAAQTANMVRELLRKTK